jgi:hypothetical protein
MSRPQTPQELFNHRHASLRNIIERIFGVMKRQWRILQLPPEYHMDVQARIPDALCALHNFIRKFDPDIFDEEADDLLEYEGEEGGGELNELGDGPADAQERRRADNRRDEIARQMWEDYVAVRAARGNPV